MSQRFEQRARSPFGALQTRRTVLQRGGMAVASFGALGSVLAACGGSNSSSSSSTGGTVGGTLVYAGWEGEDEQRAAAPFLKRTGTKINSTYVASGDELLTKLKLEGEGTIDVVTQNKDYIPLSIDGGFIEEIDLSKLKNVDAIYPALARAPWAVREGKTYAIPLAWGDSPIVYDPRKWDGPPAKYSELAEPKYKNQLTCLDDPYSVLWLFAGSLGFPNPSHLTQEQLDETLQLALTVKPNIVTIGSFGDMTDVIVRGDASMAFAAWELMLILAEEKGVKLESKPTTVDEGFYWSDAYSIPKGAPNAATAYAFIDQMISPRSNADLAEGVLSAVSSKKALPLLPKELADAFEYSIVEEEPEKSVMALSVLPPIADEGDIVGIAAWRKAWEEFKSA
jgi:spermidine/putrescine-binding protein